MKLWNINSIIKMKTHINYTRKNRLAKRLNASGMTLIEISLVIALLLGLIAVVFMGLGTYRQGADKAKCKMQLSAVQKAVRSGANMQNLAIGAPLASTCSTFHKMFHVKHGAGREAQGAGREAQGAGRRAKGSGRNY